jgi:hypothetical protein
MVTSKEPVSQRWCRQDGEGTPVTPSRTEPFSSEHLRLAGHSIRSGLAAVNRQDSARQLYLIEGHSMTDNETFGRVRT